MKWPSCFLTEFLVVVCDVALNRLRGMERIPGKVASGKARSKPGSTFPFTKQCIT